MQEVDKVALVRQLSNALEQEFQDQGISHRLDGLVQQALDMTDGQIRGVLVANVSPIVIPKQPPEKKISFSPKEPYKGLVPIGLWRRVCELEAIHRGLADVDLASVLNALSKRVASDEPEYPDYPELDPEEPKQKAKAKKTKRGLTAKNAPAKIRKKVISLRKKGLSFAGIEKQLGLRQVRGMTAHRIYTQELKARKKAKKKAGRK